MAVGGATRRSYSNLVRNFASRELKGRFKGKNKGGAELDAGFEHVFEMRDGKVIRFENKPDDAEAWAAGWGG